MAHLVVNRSVPTALQHQANWRANLRTTLTSVESCLASWIKASFANTMALLTVCRSPSQTPSSLASAKSAIRLENTKQKRFFLTKGLTSLTNDLSLGSPTCRETPRTFLDVSCHLKCSKKNSPKIFFTCNFFPLSCGSSKVRHNATKHSSLGFWRGHNCNSSLSPRACPVVSVCNPLSVLFCSRCSLLWGSLLTSQSSSVVRLRLLRYYFIIISVVWGLREFSL